MKGFKQTVQSITAAVLSSLGGTGGLDKDEVYFVDGIPMRARSSKSAVVLAQRRAPTWLTFVPTGGSAPDLNTASVGFTHHAMIETVCAFDGARIPLMNFDTANPLIITAVSVAVGDGSNVENSAATYVNAISSAVTVPVAKTINGRVYPSIVLSDPVYISSVPRADGKAGAFLFVRLYTASASTPNVSVWQTGGNGTDGWESTGSRIFACRYQSGNFTSTNQTGFTASTVRAFTPIFGAMYLPRVSRATSFLCPGDSITRYGSQAQKGWHYRMVEELRAAGRFVDYANFGVQSATADEFAANAEALVPLFRPQCVVYPAYTPNSGPANVPVMRASLMRTKSVAQQYGADLLLWNGCPRSQGVSTTPYYLLSEDATRLAWLLEAASLCPESPMADTAAPLSSNTAPTAFGSAALTADGLHLSSAGNDVVKAVMLAKYDPWL